MLSDQQGLLEKERSDEREILSYNANYCPIFSEELFILKILIRGTVFVPRTNPCASNPRRGRELILIVHNNSVGYQFTLGRCHMSKYVVVAAIGRLMLWQLSVKNIFEYGTFDRTS